MEVIPYKYKDRPGGGGNNLAAMKGMIQGGNMKIILKHISPIKAFFPPYIPAIHAPDVDADNANNRCRDFEPSH